MQIPKNPSPFSLGFLSRPQPASVRGPSVLGASTPAPAGEPNARTARAPEAAGLASANTLDEAVRALRADGRLPRRGSLIDLSA